MGKPPTPDQEAQALRALVTEAHGVIKDLRGCLREARALILRLLDGFQETANNEIRQLANFLQSEQNRHAADLNASVAVARKELMDQLTMSELAYNEQTGRWAIIFKSGCFDDEAPPPYPDQPVKDITP